MKKHHVHTTLSQKHWDLLNKLTDEYETKQKALELSLEALNKSGKQSRPLSEDERYWLDLAELKSACIIQKDALKVLMNTMDMAAFQEYVAREKPIEFVLEYYFQRPFARLTIKEVVEGLKAATGVSHWFDLVDYTEDDDCYVLKLSHSLGLKCSKMQEILLKSVFETYGARAESTISEKAFFMKIYKNPDEKPADHN